MIRQYRQNLCRNFMRRLFSNQDVIVKSPFENPLLSSDYLKMPFPLFLFRDYLDPVKIRETAVIDGHTGASFTFGDNYYASYSLAESLRKDFHVKKGDCIAIMSPNHLLYFPVFLGVSLTGAIASPMNPLYSPTEIKYQLEITKSKIIVCHSSCLERVQKAIEGSNLSAITIILIDEDPVSGKEEERGVVRLKHLYSLDPGTPSFDYSEYLQHQFDPHSTLVLPFSSGTTGRSKGVMLSHQNLIANLLQTAQIEPKSTILCPLPFYHIYGLMVGLFTASYNTSKYIFQSGFEIQSFLECIERYRVTRLYIVPPIALSLAKHPLVDRYDISSVETIMCGAAPLKREQSEACAKRFNCYLKQIWGMTELSPIGTIAPEKEHPVVHPDYLHGSGGVLVAGTEAKLIHPETGEDLLPQEEGELLIRGPQVMRGYLNHAEATTETILAGGWLRTGDIASFNQEGWLYIRDRLKELIKYKGYQVPPAELEAIIATMPEVKDVVVIPVPEEEAGEVPRAYVVKQEDCSPEFSEKDVLEYVHRQVAPYKRLRGGVRFTESIPKTPSGKLLRRKQIEIDRFHSSEQ